MREMRVWKLSRVAVISAGRAQREKRVGAGVGALRAQMP